MRMIKLPRNSLFNCSAAKMKGGELVSCSGFPKLLDVGNMGCDFRLNWRSSLADDLSTTHGSEHTSSCYCSIGLCDDSVYELLQARMNLHAVQSSTSP